ncbi:MAG: adenylate/guanylate cyclase domain-containing protein, partial [Pseudomonadota bacterium]
TKLELGGEQREMTFLFTDIAGFTAFAENIDPAVLTKTLNAYLDQMCQIVMAHGGTIDKIVGDAVHALFNAPIDQPDHAQRAVTCGLALDAFGKEFAQRMRADGLNFGHTRIGINTGRCVVGNFGGSQRFDYTAHGDAINTAARLEAANKHLGTTICVAGSTADQCRDIAFRPIGSLLLQGRQRGLDTFEPIPASEGKSQRFHDYNSAFALISAAAPEALQAFGNLVGRYPQDRLAAMHFRRLSDGQAGTEFRVEK